MSKPMTYTRIGELAWNNDKDVQELIAEVRRLRECIAKAPHHPLCEECWLQAQDCTCWKRQALGEQ